MSPDWPSTSEWGVKLPVVKRIPLDPVQLEALRFEVGWARSVLARLDSPLGWDSDIAWAECSIALRDLVKVLDQVAPWLSEASA